MNFLLIHGSWHGGWCWYKIEARLNAEGHNVCAPDLAGRGEDKTHPFFISAKSMLMPLAQLVRQNAPVVVIVHSRYGLLASLLAEALPTQISRTIYLASFMLPNGKKVLDYARQDADTAIRPYIEVNKLKGWDWLAREGHREVLYHDCTDDDATLASGLLQREPVRPAITKLQLSDDRYGRVPRAYIRLTEDRAVSLSMQDQLINETGADRIESIAAGHSAYFSKPDELTAKILKLAGV